MILEFGERCRRGRQTQFGFGVTSENQLYVYWRFILKEQVSSVGQAEIVCRFRRDRVSISLRSLKSRSCVNFAKIVCRFRQVFVGVRLRFRKSSPRWRIIGREKIEEIEAVSTEVRNQRSKTSALKQVRKAPGRPVEKAGRSPG